MAIAMLLVGGLIAPATANAADHCPGANEGNAPDIDTDLYESAAKDSSGASSNDTILPAGTVLCVFGGSNNSGIQAADGSTELRSYLPSNPGGQAPDVSHYLIYTPVEVTQPPVYVANPDLQLVPMCKDADTFVWDIINNSDGHVEYRVRGTTGTFTATPGRTGDAFRSTNDAQTILETKDSDGDWKQAGGSATKQPNRDACRQPGPVKPDPEDRTRSAATEWVDGTFECDDTTVTQTRSVTTITERSTDDGETWSETSRSTGDAARIRDLTEDEQEACPATWECPEGTTPVASSDPFTCEQETLIPGPAEPRGPEGPRGPGGDGPEVAGVALDEHPDARKPPTGGEDAIEVPAKVHTPVHALVETPSAPEHAQVLGKVIEAKEMPRTGVPALALILMGLTSMGLGTTLVSRKRS